MKKLYFLIFLWIFFPLNVFANDTFLSLKKNKVNVRYGPGFEYPIKYIYKKINLPIKQIDKKENFRRIIDLKNNSGWIHVSQLKKNNSVIPSKLNKNSLLISEGIIDSASIIDMILYLEKKYKISFNENDLLSDESASPLGISKIIIKKIK